MSPEEFERERQASRARVAYRKAEAAAQRVAIERAKPQPFGGNIAWGKNSRRGVWSRDDTGYLPPDSVA